MVLAVAFLLLQAGAPAPADEGVRKVVDAYRTRLAALVAKHAAPKDKYAESMAAAAAFDAAVVEELSAKLKRTPDEVRAAWAQRERKPRKIGVGDGSWILLDGQDGGLDSDVKGTPKVERDLVDDLVDRNPGALTRRKPKPPPEPVPLGKPLKTREEWWATAGVDERRALLEAQHARTSKAVEKSEEKKDCPTCRGKGVLNVNRGGIGLSVVCGRCHGARYDLIVVAE